MRPPPGPLGRAWRRVADGLGFTELEQLADELALLEEAVDENARLAAPLDRYVARIEAELVPLLERSAEPAD